MESTHRQTCPEDPRPRAARWRAAAPRRQRLLCAALLGALACSSSSSPPPGTAPDAGTPPPDGGAGDVILGGFNVVLIPATVATASAPATPAYTSIGGKVYDAANPPTIVWEPRAQANGCTVLAVRAPFCNPGCGDTAACVADGVCVPYPSAQNLGTVKVTGVGPAPVTLVAVKGNYQAPGSASLPYPPAAEGAPIEVESSGGALGPFVVRGVGVQPLEFPGPIPLASGQPVQLTWTAPPRPELTRIQIRVDISHHGGTRSKIECDVPDTGSLTIPAALVTQLVDLGVAGFPAVSLTRVATSSTTVARGRITLQVSSSVDRDVQIPGVVSCSSNDECPAGQTCPPDKRCR